MNDPRWNNNTVNGGFYDLPADERAAAMEAASDRADGTPFFDLSPEERGAAYERALGIYDQ